jgi:hypothetical protein
MLSRGIVLFTVSKITFIFGSQNLSTKIKKSNACLACTNHIQQMAFLSLLAYNELSGNKFNCIDITELCNSARINTFY